MTLRVPPGTPADGVLPAEPPLDPAVQRAGLTLMATVWLSSALFGIYILAAYAGAVVVDDLPAWNAVLPRLYEPRTPTANLAIGLHFAAGGIILVLGCVQLIAALRERYPAAHRVLGRIYVTASLLTGVGGLGYIAAKRTVGGAVMDVGFGLYGIFVIVCAVQTWRHARARRIAVHREWALRLFALAIGSWLYRIDYGFWILLTDGLGHREDFHGPFDAVMAFWFYIPNLVVVEMYLRGRRPKASPLIRWSTVVVMAIATGFLLLGTYFFTTQLWGPAIIDRFSSSP